MCRTEASGRRPLLRRAAAALLVASIMAACRQQMADDPKQEPLTQSDFFADARSARMPVDGTVPQGSFDKLAFDVAEEARGFPLPVTRELVERGRGRFAIFCSPCHGLAGNGDGMVARRGFPRPPSFHIDRLRSAPEGHIFNVITNGRNPMPEYASRLEPRDRWAIVAYIRVLQLSQNALATELPAAMRRELANVTQQEEGQ